MVWNTEKSKQYYEGETQRKVLYVPNLSEFLNMLNMQILKLPHEMQEPSANAPMGTTYDDIVRSFCNGVDVAYANTAPIRAEMQKQNKPKWVNYEEPEAGQRTKFQMALRKLEWIYCLLDEFDMLNERVISLVIPDVDDNYDDGLVDENEKEDIGGDMPASKQQADGEALGALEGKDTERVAKENLEAGL